MSLTFITHASWIPAASMRDNWHPAYYAPQFRELEAILSERRADLVPLSVYLEPVPANTASQSKMDRGGWVIRCTAQMAEATLSDDAEHPEVPLLVPDQGLVVCRFRGKTGQPSFYWDRSVFRGQAVTQATNLVFRARTATPIAWIQDVLQTEFSGRQLDWMSAGGLMPSIDASAILSLLVERPSDQDLRRRSEQVIAGLRQRLALNSRRVVISAEYVFRPVMLTAATFKERLEQFEAYLIQHLPDDRRIFYVEAATDEPTSGLFVVRPVHIPSQSESSEFSWRSDQEEDPDETDDWRSWYWSKQGSAFYKLYNSLVADSELPAYLLTRIAPPKTWLVGTFRQAQLPRFQAFRDVVRTNWQEAIARDEIASELLRLWHTLNRESPALEEFSSWLSEAYRPVLAIRVHREGEPAGAYLIYGSDQLEDPYAAASELELLGTYLGESLNRSVDVIDESARSESLRRLSWVMHQVASPLMRLRNAANEIAEYLSRSPDCASQPLPDEQRAYARAAMQKKPLVDFTVGGRLATIMGAIQELDRLRYQVRRFKNAHRDPQREAIIVAELMSAIAKGIQDQLPEVLIEFEIDAALVCPLDPAMIKAALEEVTNNSCREFRERGTSEPNLRMVGYRRGRWAVLQIIDNAFPVDEKLPTNVFDEGATTYAEANKGSGLGLAIVRTSIQQHGGRCHLDENVDSGGNRLPGVTFTAEVPAMMEE